MWWLPTAASSLQIHTPSVVGYCVAGLSSEWSPWWWIKAGVGRPGYRAMGNVIYVGSDSKWMVCFFGQGAFLHEIKPTHCTCTYQYSNMEWGGGKQEISYYNTSNATSRECSLLLRQGESFSKVLMCWWSRYSWWTLLFLRPCVTVIQ